jgi:hypothetical protein
MTPNFYSLTKDLSFYENLTAGGGGGNDPKILQVISTFSNTATTSTSSSETSFLSASITPSASTSNVLVLINLGMVDVYYLYTDILFFLYRDTTLIGQGSGGTDDGPTAWGRGNLGGSAVGFNFLDTAISTTSTTDYELKFALITAQASQTGYLNTTRDDFIRTGSSLILMEVDGS